MALVEQKEAGLIAQAASKYLYGIAAGSTRDQLAQVLNLAKAAEQSQTGDALTPSQFGALTATC